MKTGRTIVGMNIDVVAIANETGIFTMLRQWFRRFFSRSTEQAVYGTVSHIFAWAVRSYAAFLWPIVFKRGYRSPICSAVGDVSAIRLGCL